MKLLAVESSSPVLSLALQKEAAPPVEISLEGHLSHVENLMPLLHQLLGSSGVTLEEIDLFLIGRGPGSFTGLRVGYATLKAFLFGQNRICYGALSLDMMAEAVPVEEGTPLAALIDAHRGLIYYRIYEGVRGTWQAVSAPEVRPAAQCAASLRGGTRIIGNALARYGDLFKEPSLKLRRLEDSFQFPRASSLLRMWSRRHPGLQKLERPEDFVPLYFRLSEPEERRRREPAC